MNNNKRLNNKRLVLKRKEETIISKHQIKGGNKTLKPKALPSSPKKEKIQESHPSSKSTLKLAVAKRLKRDYAFGDMQRRQFFQQKPFSSEKRFKTTFAFVLFATKFLIFRGEKRNEMILITYTRVREKERLLLLLHILSLVTKVSHTASHKARAQKKRSQHVPLKRLNLLLVNGA
jgi:hypothetical protein|tara:strand:- start:947 stop:1474 length:528 start_codon:yes stop_codon:yes gene_type:complete